MEEPEEGVGLCWLPLAGGGRSAGRSLGRVAVAGGEGEKGKSAKKNGRLSFLSLPPFRPWRTAEMEKEEEEEGGRQLRV